MDAINRFQKMETDIMLFVEEFDECHVKIDKLVAFAGICTSYGKKGNYFHASEK